MKSPALEALMGGYLHQDYDLIGSVEDNIDTFIRDFADLALQVPTEVEVLLAGHQSEEQLERVLEEMGCQLSPPASVGSYRSWLSQIAEHVRQMTGQR